MELVCENNQNENTMIIQGIEDLVKEPSPLHYVVRKIIFLPLGSVTEIKGSGVRVGLGSCDLPVVPALDAIQALTGMKKIEAQDLWNSLDMSKKCDCAWFGYDKLDVISMYQVFSI